MSKKEYQLGENPPPEGAHTGINKQEIIEPVRDDSNEMEQIQHRLTAFEDEWAEMKKFYEKYSYVSSVSVEETDKKALAQAIQSQVDAFDAMRETKKQDEIERLRLIEELRLQKLQEEEALARKKAEEEAEALRKVTDQF